MNLPLLLSFQFFAFLNLLSLNYDSLQNYPSPSRFFLFKICQCLKRGQGELTLNGKKANVVESKRLSEAVEIAVPKYSPPMVNNDKLQR